MVVTLESLLNDNISLFSDNDCFNFEDMMLEYSEICLEQSDIDVEIANAFAAESVCINCEDFKSVANKVGKAIVEAIKKIIIAIIRLFMFIGQVYQIPFKIIRNLIITKNFVASIKLMVLEMKLIDEEIKEVFENILKITPNAKRLRENAKLQIEIAERVREYSKKIKNVPAWFEEYRRDYEKYFTSMSEEAFENWKESMMRQFDEQFGTGDGSSGSTKTTQSFSSEFDRWEKTVMNSDDFVCKDENEFFEAAEEVAGMKSESDVQQAINECQASVKLLERIVNNKTFEEMQDDKVKSRILKLLDGAKARLVDLSKVSAQQAKDVKEIVSKLKELEAKTKKK